MNTFKTQFNYLLFSFQLLLVFYFACLTMLCFYALFFQWEKGVSSFLGMIFVCSIMAAFTYGSLHPLLLRSKNYTIGDDDIKVKNILTRQRTAIPKSELKGFSTSKKSYRLFSFNLVLLYLRDGKKIELMQFSYWNFKHIQEAFSDRGYLYLRDEPYEKDLRLRRAYLFDK